jgi:hypothetical protein
MLTSSCDVTPLLYIKGNNYIKTKLNTLHLNQEPWQRLWYSNQGVGAEVGVLTRVKNFHFLYHPNQFVAHAATYPMGTRGSFHGGKAVRA